MTSTSVADYKAKYAQLKPRGKPKRKKSKLSQGEEILSVQLKALNIRFEREYLFHPKRKWRADFHILEQKILIEVEGGIWSGGRHTRGKGYIGDMEKYNAATTLGFQVLRFSTEQVKSGLAVRQIEQLVRGTE